MTYPETKRWCDTVMAFLLLIALSWLFGLIALAYAVSFNYPVLYRQQRVGKDGRVFNILKFRTLRLDTNIRLSDRRFALGSFLRFTSLDELPQLWNILIGDMSFVGPRPLPVDYWDKMNDRQRSRHSVKPGLTGLAQVSGRHGLTWREKFDYDLQYVRNRSLTFDLTIILKTIVLLLSFRKDRSLDELPFTGNE